MLLLRQLFKSSCSLNFIRHPSPTRPLVLCPPPPIPVSRFVSSSLHRFAQSSPAPPSTTSTMSLSPNKCRVLIFGAGNFGSCLADHLGDSEHDVYMWTREERIVTHFNQHHRNPLYLKDHAFSENIKAIGPDLPQAGFLSEMDVLIFAIPTQGLR